MRRQVRLWRRGLTVLAVFAAAGCSATADMGSDGAPGPEPSPTASAGTLPGLPTGQEARKELSGLAVAAQGSMAGYSRDKFPHWAEQGDSCSTREVVLERDGKDVRRDDECRPLSGTWAGVYENKSFTDPEGLDIDHTVPLANAWRSGARSWTEERRKAFANDLTHPQLLAVSAATNRAKGDQGPDEWRPPAKTYWCVYARSWVSVKTTYELSVTDAEKRELGSMLGTCSP
ncbi:HNH endonuclease family protein [Streptomyces sp. NPDC050264]|uniref:HNH endonuclease family protein n=1 Tax=Streptomyces sp. NPDC050264 TaxID=3155038 RepID=UPI0034431D7C